tara:strand:- start:61254 stop:63452 length:2199 start_codon:yes stop_codon:yes gene_type:complete
MAKEETYSAQRRGDRGAYERYLAGMDTSMRQKVALTAAHLLSEGKIADMGMGSGTGSEALAALYPAMEVVGVDVEPTMVELAQERYTLKNLSFVVGDIAKAVFPEASIDGIVNSSVLHHVTSFNGYGAERASEALATQTKQLTERGILIVRDFVAPKAQTVLLDLPDDDGDTYEDLSGLSTAALFEKFAATYRPLSDAPGFAFETLEASDAKPGCKRYRVAAVHAVEFVLRKDYRRDWDSELLEAYLYFAQPEFEQTYADMGLRVLASTAIWNPWIVRNRFEGKFEWRSEEGAMLEFPATNYIIVGEKVPAHEGVRFRQGEACEPIGFLQLEHYRDLRTGSVMDLVRRPNRTVDIIPWFELEGDCFILARASYPRPIICAKTPGTQSLDSRHSAGYVVEPLVVVQGDKPLGMTVEETLESDAGIASDKLLGFRKGSSYYPSPGGVQEEVRACFVEVEPTFAQRPLDNHTGFTTAGRVLAIEAQQILRASQIGGLPDARLELNAYDLLLTKGKTCGPWLGETIELADATSLSLATPTGTRTPRRVFEKAHAESSGGFLEIVCAQFEELDSKRKVRTAATIEFVAPKPLSLNTMAAAVLAKQEGRIWIGLDDDDLPAAQGFSGNSNLFVTPAWRLPKTISGSTPASTWVRHRLLEEYGLGTSGLWQLGGPYYPSLGLTPEIVHPLAVEVTSIKATGKRGLVWHPLDEVVAARNTYKDGHLRIALLRAAHALGLV